MVLTSTDVITMTSSMTSITSINNTLAPNILGISLSSTVQTSSNVTAFKIYLPGLYGLECRNRIYNFINSNNITTITLKDVNCACWGICEPPRAPNPDAWTYYLAWKANTLQVQQAQYLRDYAPFLAITIVIVIVGLTGSNKNCFINQ